MQKTLGGGRLDTPPPPARRGLIDPALAWLWPDFLRLTTSTWVNCKNKWHHWILRTKWPIKHMSHDTHACHSCTPHEEVLGPGARCKAFMHDLLSYDDLTWPDFTLRCTMHMTYIFLFLLDPMGIILTNSGYAAPVWSRQLISRKETIFAFGLEVTLLLIRQWT